MPKPKPPIKPGAKAPAFELKDQSGTVHRLSDYAGRAVVLFFYPKDDTEVCTAEACAFSDASAKLKRAGAVALGVSTGGARAKANFAKKRGIGVPLLADDRKNEAGKKDPKTAQEYGVWHEKSMFGKPYMGMIRTTYLIGPDGRVANRWDKVDVDGHVDEVLRAVKALEVSA